MVRNYDPCSECFECIQHRHRQRTWTTSPWYRLQWPNHPRSQSQDDNSSLMLSWHTISSQKSYISRNSVDYAESSPGQYRNSHRQNFYSMELLLMPPAERSNPSRMLYTTSRLPSPVNRHTTRYLWRPNGYTPQSFPTSTALHPDEDNREMNSATLCQRSHEYLIKCHGTGKYGDTW